MTTSRSKPETRRHLPFGVALVATLAMDLAITWIDVLQPPEPLLSILALLPGLISVTALLLSGMKPSDLYLRFGRLSRQGLLVLIGITVLLLPVLGSGTGFTG